MKRKPGRRVAHQRWRDDAPLRVRLVAEWPQGHGRSSTLTLGARSRLVRIMWLAGPPEQDTTAIGLAQPGDDTRAALAASGGRSRNGRGRAN